MNGVHDMGGMHGFGRVAIEPDERVFAADWERSVFGMTIVALGVGLFNLDEFRYATEREDPARYLSSPYYEHWLSALELLVREKGIFDESEMRAARERLAADDTGAGRPARLAGGQPASELRLAMREAIRSGASVQRESGDEPAFRIGDRVVTRNRHRSTHTRLPRYARGCRGTVTASHGAFVFPDTNANGEGEQPQHLYSVRFEASELWGDEGGRRESVSLDLWESYLEGRARADA